MRHALLTALTSITLAVQAVDHPYQQCSSDAPSMREPTAHRRSGGPYGSIGSMVRLRDSSFSRAWQ